MICAASGWHRGQSYRRRARPFRTRLSLYRGLYPRPLPSCCSRLRRRQRELARVCITSHASSFEEAFPAAASIIPLLTKDASASSSKPDLLRMQSATGRSHVEQSRSPASQRSNFGIRNPASNPISYRFASFSPARNNPHLPCGTVDLKPKLAILRSVVEVTACGTRIAAPDPPHVLLLTPNIQSKFVAKHSRALSSSDPPHR